MCVVEIKRDGEFFWRELGFYEQWSGVNLPRGGDFENRPIIFFFRDQAGQEEFVHEVFSRFEFCCPSIFFLRIWVCNFRRLLRECDNDVSVGPGRPRWVLPTRAPRPIDRRAGSLWWWRWFFHRRLKSRRRRVHCRVCLFTRHMAIIFEYLANDRDERLHFFFFARLTHMTTRGFHMSKHSLERVRVNTKLQTRLRLAQTVDQDGPTYFGPLFHIGVHGDTIRKIPEKGLNNLEDYSNPFQLPVSGWPPTFSDRKLWPGFPLRFSNGIYRCPCIYDDETEWINVT